ncbi:peptidase inhibitor family I36 protein [Krasilnikovia sp. MM14-A1259]|uniref:peptidase inhibitor family I36 protein n=1 Tax=Krasilnikovia sp. MM14-A1259 TaxID=3373539 RepID=UPI00382951C8
MIGEKGNIMKYNARRAATVLAALTMAVGAFAAPAQAAPANGKTPAPTGSASLDGLGDCPSGYACLWVLNDFTGRRWQGQNANSTLPSFIDNDSWSSFNHGVNCTVHFWEGPGYTGVALNEGIGSRRADLRQNSRPGGGNWADVISSMNWC